MAMNFDQRIFHFVRKNKLMRPRALILVGVSGGADSMALLHALISLRHDLGIQLNVLHFNHRLRPEALHDEQFVASTCKQLNIPCTIARRSSTKIKHLSEDDARQMRFQFFIKTARHLKAQSVALAHTRNDLAETVLMRLMRGSGLYGLRAILPMRNIDGITFVRPLLGVNRLDVEHYLKNKKSSFCTDQTNHLLIYERNRVRLKLLPLLAKEYNPRIVDALSDLGMTAGEDYEFLSNVARKQIEKKVIILKNKVKIELKVLNHQHLSIARLILRHMVEMLTQDPSVLSYEHIQALENLLISGAKGTVDLPNGLKAAQAQQFLEIYEA